MLGCCGAIMAEEPQLLLDGGTFRKKQGDRPASEFLGLFYDVAHKCVRCGGSG
jgi:hypothetical protein